MNKETSLRKSGSLLERAAEIYDFRAALAARPVQVAPAEESPAPALLETGQHALEQREAQPEPQPEQEVQSFERSAELLLDTPAPSRVGRALPVPIDRERLAIGGFICPDSPSGAVAEEFRIIKRQLLLGRTDIPAARRQTILVASAEPGEGKSFCALNLALSIAGEKDLEVLLVDGDFAKPSLAGLLGIEAGPGLIDAIADGRDVEEFIVETDIPGLSLLPAGRTATDVTELLASARTSEVLRALTAPHPRRIVIFDSPPALVASPASVLAGHAGQVMMVVRADRTTEADLREALSLLSACNNVSLVLNGTRLSVGGPRFGTYYGYDQ
jgi:exopolysaccharide/PEP-CTERM locus tyrosine autokinase